MKMCCTLTTFRCQTLNMKRRYPYSPTHLIFIPEMFNYSWAIRHKSLTQPPNLAALCTQHTAVGLPRDGTCCSRCQRHTWMTRRHTATEAVPRRHSWLYCTVGVKESLHAWVNQTNDCFLDGWITSPFRAEQVLAGYSAGDYLFYFYWSASWMCHCRKLNVAWDNCPFITLICEVIAFVLLCVKVNAACLMCYPVFNSFLSLTDTQSHHGICLWLCLCAAVSKSEGWNRL